MDKNFGGVIWTNHVLSRMSERKISQSDVWATWRSPQKSRKAKIPGAWVYYRTFGSETIEVVAKQNEKKEWLILSVWSRPKGEVRYIADKKVKPVPFWKLVFRQILGK